MQLAKCADIRDKNNDILKVWAKTATQCPWSRTGHISCGLSVSMALTHRGGNLHAVRS